ncbi:MAG: Zn-dependent alcohol dehydrogenase [Rhizobiaceae bacterium]|nr:Zn-dependent alcohol dehydrogenase [Rhizobiaceae bacterium]
MKAAVCRGFGEPLIIEEITLAEAGPGEVRVKLKACAICHSDISFMDGAWGGDLPAVYGHEGAGIVESVGKGVTKCKVGDHVVVTLIRYCGDCHYCAGGNEVLCEEVFPLNKDEPIFDASGKKLHQAMNSGAFAEAVVVEQSQLEVVPDDIAFDLVSLLACGVLTGYGAVKHASGLKEGQHAIVIGCGGVGLNSIQAASHLGAASVIGKDLSAEKLALIGEFGATHGINPTDVDGVDQVMKITGGRGADFVFVTVGSKRAIESASSYITKNGSVVVVGMPSSGTMTEYDPVTLAAWSQKIIGTKMGSAKLSEDIPELVSLYRSGKLKLEPLISGRYALENINDALDEVRNGKAIKNIIMFD